jgi:hypothetical protein
MAGTFLMVCERVGQPFNKISSCTPKDEQTRFSRENNLLNKSEKNKYSQFKYKLNVFCQVYHEFRYLPLPTNNKDIFAFTEIQHVIRYC